MADKTVTIQIRATNLTAEAFAKVQGELKQLGVSVREPGAQAVTQANAMTAAYQRLSEQGISLTDRSQKTLNRTLNEAIAKYKAMGQDVPPALAAVELATRRLQPASQSAWSSFKTMFAGFVAGQLTVAALGRAFHEVTAFVVGSVQAYAEQEAATKALSAALKAQGDVMPLRDYQDLSAEFQRTTVYGDELTQQMEAMLVEIGNVGPAQMKGALQAAMDLASGLGIDLKTATQLVGKAFAGETGTLTRYGIVIDQAKLKTEGASAVLGAIQQKFGGQAAAQAETYAGRVAQLGNAWGDTKEVIGEVIVQNPAIVRGLETLSTIIGDLNTKVTNGVPAWVQYVNLFNSASTPLALMVALTDRGTTALDRTNAMLHAHLVAQLAKIAADQGMSDGITRVHAGLDTLPGVLRANVTGLLASADATSKYRTEVQTLRDSLTDAALPGDVRKLTGAYGLLTPAQRDNDLIMRRVADAAALLFERGGLLDDRLLRLALTSEKLSLQLGAVKHGLDELPGVTNTAVQASLDLNDAQQEMSQLITGSAKDWVVYGGELLAVGDKYDILGAHAKDFSRQAIVDLSRVGSTMLTAINGSFAQMMLGAKSFKNGFLDIWKSIKAGFEQILAQMVQAFLTKFLSKILGLQGSTSAAGIFGGGGFSLMGLFGGGAGTAETIGPALMAPGTGVLASGAGGGAAAGGLTAAGIGGGLAAGGAGLGLGLVGQKIFGGAGLAAAGFGAGGGAASGALIGSIVPGIGTAVGAIIGGIGGFIGGIFGSSKGMKANDTRDQVLAQFGPGGTGTESGYGKLAAELTAATGEAGGGHLFSALINAKDVNAVKAAWEAIVPVIEQYRQAQADAAKATDEATAAQQQEATAAQQAADAHRAKVDAIKTSLGALDQQLADLHASEAPEEVMGVIEAQTRARIAAEREVLDKKLDAANTEQARLDAQAKQLTENLPAAAKEGVKLVNQYLQEVNPLHIVVDFPTTGRPAPAMHSGGLVLPHGGIRRFHEGGLASDEVLAILQRGEAVLSKTTVTRMGQSAQTDTRPGGSPGRAVTVVIQAWDGPSVDSWLRRGGARQLTEAIVPTLPDVVRRYGLT